VVNSGDEETIRKICCTGLANTLITRIAKRPSNEKVEWNLAKYTRAPSTLFRGVHVVSDRATQIPEYPKSGIRQVVVLITSLQTTETSNMVLRRTPRGNLELSRDDAEKKAKQQYCTEYVVIQKQMWNGKEEPWRLWGQTKATTLADLDSPWFAQGLTMSERLEAAKAMMEKHR
jgi:protein MBA1